MIVNNHRYSKMDKGNTEIKELLTSDAFMREGRAEKKQHWMPGAGSREEYGAWMHKTSPMLKGKQTAILESVKYSIDYSSQLRFRKRFFLKI